MSPERITQLAFNARYAIGWALAINLLAGCYQPPPEPVDANGVPLWMIMRGKELQWRYEHGLPPPVHCKSEQIWNKIYTTCE